MSEKSQKSRKETPPSSVVEKASVPPSSAPYEEATEKKDATDTDKNKQQEKKGFLRRRGSWLKHKLTEGPTEQPRQNPFTYDHMLLRYGGWRSVRTQMCFYTVLIMAACFHKSHYDLLSVVAKLGTAGSEMHVTCCCNRSEALQNAERAGAKFGVHSWAYRISMVVAGAFSLTCPLWEKHFGRKRSLTVACLLGVFVSICSCFNAAPEVRLVWSIAFAIINMTITILSVATLSEILPYNIRYMATVIYLFCIGLCNGLAVIHLHKEMIESELYLGIISALVYAAGVFVAFFYAHESIIHLVIRNKSDVVEQKIMRKEMQIYKRGSDQSREYHESVAKMIFHDLVYLDRDEPKLGKFFKKIFSNWAMAEIVFATFQSISAGAIEYEFNHYWHEHFVDIYVVNAIGSVGYVICGFIMFGLRKFHRNKALQWLFAANLFMSCARHAIMQNDKRNHCATGDHHFLEGQFQWAALIWDTFAVGLGTSLQTTILLHFLETAPSVLRPIAVIMVYLPCKFIHILCHQLLGEDGVEQWHTILPVYLYHLAIIAITMARSRMKAQLKFSLHLFDLMPPDDSKSDSERDETGEKTMLLEPASSGYHAVTDVEASKPPSSQ